MHLPWLVLLTIWTSTIESSNVISKGRSFRIDYANNRFMKDGRPFRYIGGSFHYFRTLPGSWRQRLRAIRAAGLNVVTTYVEWSLHNPRDSIYVWDGIADIESFIRIAAEEDLLVILRPGPYICAERDMGGFPYWLLTKYPNIKLRISDPDYLLEVRKWYKNLMPRMQKYLYGNGGPIIMVQVENEYGSYSCDRKYSAWIRDETSKYVEDEAVLFTNDGPDEVPCGKIKNILATLDFGPDVESEIDSCWHKLRQYQPDGPLVNTEFYPGWLTHWQEPFSRVNASPVVDSLRYMLEAGANVNLYMFSGGTNFGFKSGANNGGAGEFQPITTSYDYDAPLDEAGDPTLKYMLIRDVIKDYLPLPNIPVPRKAPKMKIPDIQLRSVARLLSPFGRYELARPPIHSSKPLTFEAIGQDTGFVLYETTLPEMKMDPSALMIPNLRDRAHVLINDRLIGILSRESQTNSISLSAGYGGHLQILVENQGRIGFNVLNDSKGIIGDVLLNNRPLVNWTITGFPLEHLKPRSILTHLKKKHKVHSENDQNSGVQLLRRGPRIYAATFEISEGEAADTYINPIGWGKGIVFINGFNLGRYWPLVGPQLTLYLPKELLMQRNSIVLIELQRAPKSNILQFSDFPILDHIQSSKFVDFKDKPKAALKQYKDESVNLILD